MALIDVEKFNKAAELHANVEEESEAESAEEIASEENASESGEERNGDDEDGNMGWANSIAKVLSTTKPKTKKSVVLSRAKKLNSAGKESSNKVKEDYGFEIDGEVKEVKEEKPDTTDLKQIIKQRKNLQLQLRVRPSWRDIERERILRKVATKGVVQLFNAVRIQQKDLEQQLEEVGPLDSRKDAVLNNINKKKFLDVLMGGNRAKSEAVDNSVKYEKESDGSDGSDEDNEDDAKDTGRKRKSEWSVLRPDYMTNKKIKHWDEEEEDNDAEDSDNSEENDE